MWSDVRAYRRKVLTDGINERSKYLIRDVCHQFHAQIERLEVMPDHVHLVVSVDPQFGIHRLIRHIKGRSSRILRQEYPSLCTHMPSLWTNSYFVATTGGAPLDVITHYIQEQKRV